MKHWIELSPAGRGFHKCEKREAKKEEVCAVSLDFGSLTQRRLLEGCVCILKLLWWNRRLALKHKGAKLEERP